MLDTTGLIAIIAVLGFLILLILIFVLFKYCCQNRKIIFWNSSKKSGDGRLVWKKGHNSALRGNLVHTYKVPIENHYEINLDEVVGMGASGIVVVGKTKGTNVEYAIKFVRKPKGERIRIERELHLLKDVDHANIVRLFAVYDSPQQIGLVMELCTGGHLGDLLARQPSRHLDEAWAKSLMHQLVSAVAHIHSRGICHRSAQVKLIDFGFGTRFVGVTPLTTKCGTLYTTAPEVLREKYDERCDVWSLGVVAYILLCGRRPFESVQFAGGADNGKAGMITNILLARYHFDDVVWDTVSLEAMSFVRELLKPNYETRISSQKAFKLKWLADPVNTNTGRKKLMTDSTRSGVIRAVGNIRRAVDQNSFRRTSMLAVVFSITPHKSSSLRGLFQFFDINSSGELSRTEFKFAIQSFSPDLSDADADQLFDVIDMNCDGSISFTEFLAATIDPREISISEMNKAFSLLDRESKGYITHDDLKRVLGVKNDTNKITTHTSNSHNISTISRPRLGSIIEANAGRPSHYLTGWSRRLSGFMSNSQVSDVVVMDADVDNEAIHAFNISNNSSLNDMSYNAQKSITAAHQSNISGTDAKSNIEVLRNFSYNSNKGSNEDERSYSAPRNGMCGSSDADIKNMNYRNSSSQLLTVKSSHEPPPPSVAHNTAAGVFRRASIGTGAAIAAALSLRALPPIFLKVNETSGREGTSTRADVAEYMSPTADPAGLKDLESGIGSTAGGPPRTNVLSAWMSSATTSSHQSRGRRDSMSIEDRVSLMMMKADTDKDGKLSYAEFLKALIDEDAEQDFLHNNTASEAITDSLKESSIHKQQSLNHLGMESTKKHLLLPVNREDVIPEEEVVEEPKELPRGSGGLSRSRRRLSARSSSVISQSQADEKGGASTSTSSVVARRHYYSNNSPQNSWRVDNADNITTASVNEFKPEGVFANGLQGSTSSLLSNTNLPRKSSDSLIAVDEDESTLPTTSKYTVENKGVGGAGFDASLKVKFDALSAENVSSSPFSSLKILSFKSKDRSVTPPSPSASPNYTGTGSGNNSGIQDDKRHYRRLSSSSSKAITQLISPLYRGGKSPSSISNMVMPLDDEVEPLDAKTALEAVHVGHRSSFSLRLNFSRDSGISPSPQPIPQPRKSNTCVSSVVSECDESVNATSTSGSSQSPSQTQTSLRISGKNKSQAGSYSSDKVTPSLRGSLTNEVINEAKLHLESPSISDLDTYDLT